MTDRELPRGVTFDKAGRCYKARIGHKGKTINLGRFATVGEAAAAYAAGVEKYGSPVFGKLTSEQEQRRDENYRAWLERRVTFCDHMRDQIGLFNPARPWSVGVLVKDGTGRVFRLTGYREERTKFGDVCWVALFDTPCEREGCANKARTYHWLNRDGPKNPCLLCEDHDGGRTSNFAANRPFINFLWDAVHQSMGLDRYAGAMPQDLRKDAEKRARVLRPALRVLLDVVYADLSDVPEDWWRGVLV